MIRSGPPTIANVPALGRLYGIHRAIVAAATAHGPLATATGFRSITGRGVHADIDGRAFAVGGPALLRERGLTEPDRLETWSSEWKQRGAAVLYLVRDDDVFTVPVGGGFAWMNIGDTGFNLDARFTYRFQFDDDLFIEDSALADTDSGLDNWNVSARIGYEF